jgi:hypothetical protein
MQKQLAAVVVVSSMKEDNYRIVCALGTFLTAFGLTYRFVDYGHGAGLFFPLIIGMWVTILAVCFVVKGKL